MNSTPLISTDLLRQMLNKGEPVNVIDIRPMQERAEWMIPGSIHIDAYHRVKQHDASVFEVVHLDKSVPVVTVCAGGKASLVAADMLRQRGYNAFSLQDGMKGWSLAWNTAYKQYEGFELWQVRRTGKGCLSYIIASNKEAVIIDASLPVEVYTQLVNQHHLTVKYVLETHIHADHLSRSREVAAHFKAPLFLPVPNKVQFAFNPIKENNTFFIGKLVIQSLPTPGHTLDSFSFYIADKIIFTGDTLFTNGVGRPDLKANPEETREKARLLYHSLNKLLALPDSVIVLPAHTSQPVSFDDMLVQTTIDEARKNIALLQSREEEFINSLLKKIPDTPPNFLSIAEKNLLGNYEGINPIDLEAGANRCAVS
ncbi:MBL fold metallo-hydrolase [Chitinophagaceae bacterium LB-8]|uniref:MBL fold metallo-hydrolase n=1 Tax=Paraflavisolibacter caeni TaxID=2982496 RepID=A0A9X3B912_9BACT|nr:MBL fold metallo-hydrolase [Paraflavisolibacter caeni]MCU7550491.1 MBL fold metallo-hydrolase [Paraflavisolibacter caeni]